MKAYDLIVRKAHGYTTYGIIETPCWPCRYYAGPIRQDRDGNWYGTDNSTHLFHRTMKEATAAYERMVG